MVTLPTALFKDQVTEVFELPVTVAENCLVCDAVSVTAVGETETAKGGFSVTTAVAFFVESATLVAVTVTL